MHAQALHAPTSRDDETRGLWLGLLGVAIFALTLPMTRMAVGPAEAPQLPPLFVTAGRAALAGLLALAWLRATRAPWPTRAQLPVFGASALGTVVGFPLFIGLGLLIAGKNAINDWMGRKQRADKAHCSLPAAGARTTQL